MQEKPEIKLLTQEAFLDLLGALTRERDLAIAKIQIQNQPQINAQYGRKIGDDVISSVAKMLQERDHALLVGQISPTLFGLASTDSDDTHELLNAIKHGLDEINQTNKFSFLIDLAYGVTVSDHTVIKDVQAWLDEANIALMASTRTGRGQIFERENLISEHIRSIFGRLTDKSMTPEGMHWVFQPIVETETGKIYGYEALARWELPDYGNIPPSTFIRIAEELDMVRFIDKWALHAVETAHDKLFKLGGQCVSVNISPQTLIEDNSLLVFVNEMIGRNENCDCQLIIELTESSVANAYQNVSPEGIRDKLAELRRSGALIAIDDFGTGETSLATVGSLPCDLLKLDRSLLHLGSDKLTHGMIDIGRQIANLLQAKVVLEGVENADDLAFAKATGIDFVQGWHVGYPISVD